MALEQSLQDIEKQAAEQRDLLGRMDRMRDEMKEVIEDLDSEALSEETLRIQEKIVSRMLQAQRSLHKRDYNKQRESRVGEEIYSEGGAALDTEDARRQLRRDIQRALESETPEEYEELVRQYFRAITEAEPQTGAKP
jgi:CO dehydrogenase/acetyl-CoA synthase alpha subunit